MGVRGEAVGVRGKGKGEQEGGEKKEVVGGRARFSLL